MMARTEISALMANLRAKSVPNGTLERAGLFLQRFDGQAELAAACLAAAKPDSLHELAADLIQDLLERLATLEDQHG
jgi:hypothetical protein